MTGLSLRGGGWGFSPATNLPRLLLKENKRKMEPKEIPSCLIPRLLVVFTWQLEILVTTWNLCFHNTYDFTFGYLKINGSLLWMFILFQSVNPRVFYSYTLRAATKTSLKNTFFQKSSLCETLNS